MYAFMHVWFHASANEEIGAQGVVRCLCTFSPGYGKEWGRFIPHRTFNVILVTMPSTIEFKST